MKTRYLFAKIPYLCMLLSLLTAALFAAGQANAALITAHTFKCIDVEGSRIANFTPIQIYDCHGEFNQQFDLRENGSIVGNRNPTFQRCFQMSGRFWIAHGEWHAGNPVRLSWGSQSAVVLLQRPNH